MNTFCWKSMSSALKQGTDTDLIISRFHFQMCSWPGTYNSLGLLTKIALLGVFTHWLVFGFGPIGGNMILDWWRLSCIFIRVLLHRESRELFVDFSESWLRFYLVQLHRVILDLLVIFIVAKRVHILLSKRDILAYAHKASWDSFKTWWLLKRFWFILAGPRCALLWWLGFVLDLASDSVSVRSEKLPVVFA